LFALDVGHNSNKFREDILTHQHGA